MPATTTAAMAPMTPTAARQPSRAPRALTSGVPATSATELPANTAAVARPIRSRETRVATTWAMTDQNTPWASAPIRRAPSATP